jgi:putative DNA methylase
VVFASLVDDPSSHPEQFPNEKAQEHERQRLFRIIEDLMKWENSNNEQVLEQARAEIRKSCRGNPPPMLDPFCGGGSIPLEAFRLGLEAHASELNPVAVLITKALIEIPPKFTNQPPVHPSKGKRLIETERRGAAGLAEDVSHYGRWMRDEAEKWIGHLYPKVTLPKEYGGGEAVAIAWLYCRTVRCPNPACGAMMPLASKFWLATKKGRKLWVEAVVDRVAKNVRFEVRIGEPSESLDKKIGHRTSFTNDSGKKVKATFRCIVCEIGVAKGEYIDTEADQGRLSTMPMAIVAEGRKNRIYLSIDDVQREYDLEQSCRLLADPVIREKLPTAPARGTFASNAQGRIYGFKTFADYFTPRQLVALITFSDLVSEAQERVRTDARQGGMPDDGVPLSESGNGATAYANAVATYLAMSVDRLANTLCKIARWTASRDQTVTAFSRQAILMNWDYPDVNPFAGAAGDLAVSLASICGVLKCLPSHRDGIAKQLDATTAINGVIEPVICTDPPYYNNVSYADLSDFFYIWLRRSLATVYPNLFSTLLTPKAQELVATPYRFNGDRDRARKFFEDGLGKSFAHMRKAQHPDYPLTIFYAFKQTESEEDDNDDDDEANIVVSTGGKPCSRGCSKQGSPLAAPGPYAVS